MSRKINILYDTERRIETFPTDRVLDFVEKKILEKGYRKIDLNIVFVTDEGLGKINQKFLKKDYLTDIITFDYSENQLLHAELYISLERVIENATTFKEPQSRELTRIIFHGLLHIFGLRDITEREKKEMKESENRWLDDFSVKQNLL